jgi:hypothetical protein
VLWPSHCLRWVLKHRRVVVMGVPAAAGDPVAEVLAATRVPVEAAADLTAVFFLVGTIVFIVPTVPAVDHRMVPRVDTFRMDRAADLGDPMVPMVRAADPGVGTDQTVVRVAVHTVGTAHTEVGPVADPAVALFTRTSKRVA